MAEIAKLQMSSTGTEDEMRATAAKICQNYLHGTWKTVDPSKLVFRRISGGLSNFLYYVALPDDMATKYGGGFVHRDSPESDELEKDARALGRSCSFIHDEPTKVLLRIYGLVHGERAMDAIVTESVIFTLLSERRLGPKLHGVFSGGRIEEFIPARSLRTRELSEPALSMKIAEKMAAIHSMDVPLSKEPNWMWKITAKWLKTVKEERLAPGAKGKNEEENRVIARLRQIDWDKEMEWLRKFLASVESPVVFCHNDMQEGNILILEDEVQPTDETDTPGVQLLHIDNDSPIKTQKRPSQMIDSHYEDANTSDSMLSHISDSGEPKLVLIDFEYCAYNHRGFDIANHFQEWMYDYTNPEFPFYYECQEQCPTLEQKEIFIKEYLKHYNMNTSEDRMQMPTIDEINRLLNEVDAYALASHYFWTLWSIVNASKSQIPFGYWEYGLSRIETYLRLKQDVIKKDKCGYPQKRKICEVDI